ncbi:MAG: nucleotidyl transferase AbiEii/AbiGii toxin family protein [Peptostreptococcaceae bacterium]|nr:nucleotidyl transferase AbiEii/AbiGii toxin family protein [Peptostreptococcaceae bacterium]
MNSRALKDKIRNLARANNIDPQSLMQNFFLERILARIAQSAYRNNIILKGGLLIASLIGSSKRSTMDLDATLKNYPADEDKIVGLIKEIIDIDVNDGITFDYVGIISIREEDEYNGFRIKLNAKFERIVQHLKIDFSTGDIITPEDIHYTYKSMFCDEIINIQAYNIETIIAEKYETVIRRGEANTRMKDFYDLYVLKALKSDEIDFKILRSAVENTVLKRNSEDLISFTGEIFQGLEKSDELMRLWNAYRETYSYANHIEYAETVEAIKWIYEKTS